MSGVADEIRALLDHADEAVRRDPKVIKHNISCGEHLIEARCQLSYAEFVGWIKRNFRMSPKQAEHLMDMAYKARR